MLEENEHTPGPTPRCFAIDVHILDADDETVSELIRRHDKGDISLVRTDALDTELNRRQSLEHREELLSKSEELHELKGVWVLGHSRLGHTRLASDETAEAFRKLWAILWPNYPLSGPKTNSRRTRVFDTMHVHTAIMHGCVGFITRDDGLLKRSDAIEQNWGIRIVTPEQAVTL